MHRVAHGGEFIRMQYALELKSCEAAGRPDAMCLNAADTRKDQGEPFSQFQCRSWVNQHTFERQIPHPIDGLGVVSGVFASDLKIYSVPGRTAQVEDRELCAARHVGVSNPS